MKTQIERLVIGILLLAINISIILSGSRFLLFLLVLTLSTLMILELFTCLDPENTGRNRMITLVANFFFQLMAYRGWTAGYLVTPVFFFMTLFMLAVLHPYREFEDLFVTLFVSIYISFFSSFYFFFPKQGQFYLLLVLAIAWGTDTFAYIAGFFFGKTPLTSISPKKTKEGAVGGILGSIVLSQLFRLVFPTPITTLEMLLISIVGSVSAQLGDLFASRLKRKMNIKDFGTILRAHGGIMDRYDSVQFALPVVWVFFVLMRYVV